MKAGLPTEQMRTAAGLTAEQDFARDKYATGVTVLTHARVYSFAHLHFFGDLAKLALQRLTQTLYLVPCESDTLFPHLGDAVRCIYNTTPGPEIQEDPARKLLSQYFALNYTDLAGDSLYALVEEGGELMVDISRKLERLLATKTSQIDALEIRNRSLSTEATELQIICNDKEREVQEMQAREEASRTLKKKKMGSLY